MKYVVLWRDALGELFVLGEREDGVLYAPGKGGARPGTLYASASDAHAAVARSLRHWHDRNTAYVVRAVRDQGEAQHRNAPESRARHQ